MRQRPAIPQTGIQYADFDALRRPLSATGHPRLMCRQSAGWKTSSPTAQKGSMALEKTAFLLSHPATNGGIFRKQTENGLQPISVHSLHVAGRLHVFRRITGHPCGDRCWSRTCPRNGSDGNFDTFIRTECSFTQRLRFLGVSVPLLHGVLFRLRCSLPPPCRSPVRAEVITAAAKACVLFVTC